MVVAATSVAIKGATQHDDSNAGIEWKCCRRNRQFFHSGTGPTRAGTGGHGCVSFLRSNVDVGFSSRVGRPPSFVRRCGTVETEGPMKALLLVSNLLWLAACNTATAPEPEPCFIADTVGRSAEFDRSLPCWLFIHDCTVQQVCVFPGG